LREPFDPQRRGIPRRSRFFESFRGGTLDDTSGHGMLIQSSDAANPDFITATGPGDSTSTLQQVIQ
jgi:hypothetical protein